MEFFLNYNCIFVLGPTAVGKTAVSVRLAASLQSEIISADSRQVYKGLDIGSGKDLADFQMEKELALKLNPALSEKITDGKYNIPYHLIDVTELSREYSLFDYTEDFYKSFSDCIKRNIIPICTGGTGMYLDSILSSYDMIPFKENPEEKKLLEEKSFEQLKEILISEKEKLHNTSELTDKERTIKAIMMNRYSKTKEFAQEREKILSSRPKVNPLVLGTTLDRPVVRKKIEKRLKDRMENGLIEEVEKLHKEGVSWERLDGLGLEYRFISRYLQGKIQTKEETFNLLYTAICQFAKRQETWFRGMEKKGIKINWLPRTEDINERHEAALKIIRQSLPELHC